MHTDTITCKSLMLEFAADTGLLDSGIPPRRYLWTDAFAVCNFLELYRRSTDKSDLQLALKLVDQVHEVLGKHRAGSPQQGWLSGLDATAGSQHPTRAGLRIGKPQNERQPWETPDSELEWQQDGQYFHYLTRWMQALDCVARVTRERCYLQWAMELAKTAHAAFTYVPLAGAAKRMHWKMSIDLSRPLVASMGQHDPLDGLVTCLQLEATAAGFPDRSSLPVLTDEIADLLLMCHGKRWATRDPLGIGGLLLDCSRLLRLASGNRPRGLPAVVDLLEDAAISLRAFRQQNQLQQAAGVRLPFRELGLAIGLHALARMPGQLAMKENLIENPAQLKRLLDELLEYLVLGGIVERFWLQPEHMEVPTWQHHADINNVMLATCLAPDALL